MNKGMRPREAYEWLLTHHKESAYLGSVRALLAWDQRTQIPPKGHAHRAQQVALLAKLLHQRATDPRIGEMLDAVEGSELTRDPTAPEAVNIREWRRAYEKARKIPERLAVELARATAEAESAWEAARPHNDWTAFKPHLEKVLELTREVAESLGYEREPYDALLDGYEPGETAARLEPIFARLREALVDLLGRIQNAPRRPDTSVLHRHYPRAAQEAFAKAVAARIGYDFEAGRLDPTAHPFAIAIGPGDVRITTRYDENYFSGAFFGTIHEAGHAMYEQGLPAEHWGTPMGESVSLGVHESQSRMWENMVGRSLGFWRYFFPEARRHFEALKDVDLEAFHFAVNAVEPSLIRVEADEVTYNLHILLRFELELALLRGTLEVADLPEAWNEKMRAYLGLTPPDYRDGVMQDVHWSAGLIGYFPTYTLGNLYAAQFFAKAQEELGDLEAMFARGEFAPLLEWLREKIHRQGMRYHPRDLVREVTGEEVSPEPLIRYLNAKFGALYGV